jgi:hypothetical protein
VVVNHVHAASHAGHVLEASTLLLRAYTKRISGQTSQATHPRSHPARRSGPSRPGGVGRLPVQAIKVAHELMIIFGMYSA